MTARLIMKLRVQKIRLTTPDVLHLQLVHPLRPVLPEWSAGAHVDLRMPDGRVRQYSLCGDPDDRTRYEIAVKREATGRGGSGSTATCVKAAKCISPRLGTIFH
jgi:ferredoxin-NADP reductase